MPCFYSRLWNPCSSTEVVLLFRAICGIRVGPSVSIGSSDCIISPSPNGHLQPRSMLLGPPNIALRKVCTYGKWSYWTDLPPPSALLPGLRIPCFSTKDGRSLPTIQISMGGSLVRRACCDCTALLARLTCVQQGEWPSHAMQDPCHREARLLVLNLYDKT